MEVEEMELVSRVVGVVVINSRWLLAPFLLGLIVGLAALLYKFVVRLLDYIVLPTGGDTAGIIVGILKLIDLTLLANLILLVICSSYQNFLTRIDAAKHPDWPDGLFNSSFAGLKQKLLGSIAAIAAVYVLEWFMDIEQEADNTKLAWVVGILLAFSVAMLLLAVADRLSGALNGERH
jgi:uncharacterized protein (TIGR00645 family)